MHLLETIYLKKLIHEKRPFRFLLHSVLKGWKKIIRRESLSLDSLCHAVHYQFHDPGLLQQALRHRSISEKQDDKPNNERLEFLGDAVLGWIVTDAIYHQFPECDEGELTRTRSLIVSRNNLATHAEKIQLGDYLILGPGEENSGGRSRRSNLSNAYEALLGAVYLDGGISPARQIVHEQLLKDVHKLMDSKFHQNYKSWLLEYVQSIHKRYPQYHVLKEKGPDHQKEFIIEVFLDDSFLGKGRGNSKKMAEQDAARNALMTLGLLKG
jgi:ribonuclease-3